MAEPTTPAQLSFRRQRAEPAGLWVACRPARWPGPDLPWLDLARPGLGSSRPGAPLEIPAARIDACDDLVYLPPTQPARRDERDRLLARVAERGLPALVQLTVGEPAMPAPAISVYDPLPELLAGELESLSRLPAGSMVVWGLVAGITDEPQLCDRGLVRLVEAGVGRVVPCAPRLEPQQKRRLAADDERVFARLFHGAPPSERQFARRAAALGLETRFDRPPAPPGTHRPGNRMVAARLAQMADLWLRLGRAEGDAQELYRAARWAEAAEHDLAALEREGNLGVLAWLSDKTRRQVEASLTGDPPPLLIELEREYLGPGGEAASPRSG